MKPWREQGYYEILEVHPRATEEELRAAYEVLKAVYTPHTPALTTLFTPAEVAEISKKIEEAYVVLSDPKTRREYDLMIRGEGEMTVVPTPHPVATRSPLNREQLAKAIGPGEISWSGEALAKVRKYLGLEIDDIAAQIKVSRHTLVAIEGGDIHALPALVYLKGFLRAYAKALGLDPKEVTEGYLARIEGKEG